jgi:hypothetical protein
VQRQNTNGIHCCGGPHSFVGVLAKLQGRLATRKLSVLNAVKNKLLARVIAVVNKQEEYVRKVT